MVTTIAWILSKRILDILNQSFETCIGFPDMIVQMG